MATPLGSGILFLATLPGLIHAACPYRSPGAFAVRALQAMPDEAGSTFNAAAVQNLDVKAVKADLKALFTKSQSFWPADDGNYGPFMIRLAWHCAGSYRSWDGRGGCDGARQRFLPEMAWPDNTNLDKARKLLVPIKAKYGDALSWGDLIVLAGDTAIESMGGPILGFCAGRIDDSDGTDSLELGPTPEQLLVAPCTPGNGNCQEAPGLGQTTMGLIYVNPEGVLGVPVPAKSVPQIRETFGRMGMNDSETVALIGGGHAFGKTHGACPTGAGPDPIQQPNNSWPGTCGSGPLKGKGPNTFTSGFEGPWTTDPTSWSNEYFNNLLDFDYEVHKGPGGHFQWKPKNKPGKTGPLPGIMMLTTDLALLQDPSYLSIVKRFASDQKALDVAFSSAWYKLMTRDVGPITRCLGNNTAPVQPFQHPLPEPAAKQPDFAKVRADIVKALGTASTAAAADTASGKPYYGALFSTLAWQCASTYRRTDHQGGCNGGRIRFSPQKDWPQNKGLDKVLLVLKPIKDKYPTLSWADLIVLAGTVATENAAGAPGSYKFCPARSDATGPDDMTYLAPRNYSTPEIAFKDNLKVQGLTPAEGVALAARLRSPAQQKLLGYSGSWTSNPSQLSNEYFKVLLSNEWKPVKSASGLPEFKADGKALYLTPSDLAIKNVPELNAIAKGYAADNAAFLKAFASAWTKVMNADRFKGPAGSAC